MSPYRILLKIPVVGTLVYIANCYAFSGDTRATREFAGLRAWFKALFIPLLLASVLAAGVCWPLVWKLLVERRLCFSLLSAFAKTPGDTIVSIIPSLLGFGIGVYALVFALAPAFVRELQKTIDQTRTLRPNRYGSALMVNSDLAYPLTVLVITLVVGVYQKGYPSDWLIIGAWVAFWYSIVVMVEIIGVLFGLGDSSLLDKLGQKDASKTTKPKFSLRPSLRVGQGGLLRGGLRQGRGKERATK